MISNLAPSSAALRETALALVFGALGAALGWAISLPLFWLTGPAALVSVLSLMGLRLQIVTPLRDAAFVVIGVGIGAGVTPEAGDAFLKWPLAFAALAGLLVVVMFVCRAILSRGFGFSQRDAALASAPGHLSFVIALTTDSGGDVMRVTIAQSVRLLALTLVVPAVATAMGLDLSGPVFAAETRMSVPHFAGLIVVSVLVGQLLKRARVPAPLLIGALVVSSLAHLSDTVPGALDPRLAAGCLIVMGTLIGTRFVGVTWRQLSGVLLAGLVSTAVTVALAAVAAWPTALLLGMPIPHVLVAFAPGGLETMIVMGAVLGANPGFVAAAHVARLLILSLLIPLFVVRSQGSDTSSGHRM